MNHALLFSCFSGVLVAVAGCSPSNSAGSPAGSGGSSAGGTGAMNAGGSGATTPMTTSTPTVPVFEEPPPGGSGGGGAMGCATSSFETDLLPTNILLVVDRSGSMNCLPSTPTADCEAAPPTTPEPGSKWEGIVGALGNAFGELSGVPSTSVGLTYFSNNDSCGVNSEPSVGVNPLTQPQIDALNSSLGAMQPAGGTPIVGATILAYQHLHQEAQAEGNRFVVLVTDGKDSCLEENRYNVPFDPVAQLLGVEMPKAQSVNIRTFVIGAPGSEGARGLLSQIAFEGGTAKSDSCDHSGSADDVGDCHFDMTTSSDFAADFAAALDEITGRAALKCEFAIPEGKNADRDKTNVSYFAGGETEVELGLDEACSQPDIGWRFSADDDTKIELCDAACDTLRADPLGRVDIVLGCETRIIR